MQLLRLKVESEDYVEKTVMYLVAVESSIFLIQAWYCALTLSQFVNHYMVFQISFPMRFPYGAANSLDEW